MENYFQNHWLFNFISNDIDNIYQNLMLIGIDIFILLFSFILINYFIRKRLSSLIHKLIRKTSFTWDDVLSKNKVFKSVFNLISILIGRIIISELFKSMEVFNYILIIINTIIIFMLCQMVVRIINSVIGIVSNKREYNNIGLRSFFEFIRIVVYVVFSLILLSYLLNIDIKAILTSIGALTAVIILVFRDTILGLVAGIQMSLTKMIKIGDWIAIPKYNVDGNVMEINLTSSKVRNWDNTISTVPTYSLITSSIKNWEGMSESKVRRIKRSINFNIKSFKFCSQEQLKKIEKYQIISDFLKNRYKQIENYNEENKIDTDYNINGRNLTNIGIFRYYVEAYIKRSQNISNNHIIMVRQLQPTSKGLPLEIYCFSKDIEWVSYEKIQSDLFDHIITAAKEFDLEIFQSFSDTNTLNKNK